MEAWREELHDDLYLQHHGILGQKWGIRRFQNPDGSLTEEGRKRYYSSLRSESFADQIREKRALIDKHIDEAGFKKQPNGDYITKDCNCTRYTATENEPLNDRKKFICITPDDKESYYALRDYLWGGYTSDKYEINYKLKDGCRIAGANTVLQATVDAIGDRKISDPEMYKAFIDKVSAKGHIDQENANKFVENYKDMSVSELLKLASHTNIDTYTPGNYIYNTSISNYINAGTNKTVSWSRGLEFMADATANNIFYNLNKNASFLASVNSKLIERGYSGMIDMEDAFNGRTFECPAIIFNPAKSMKQISSKKI